jgi:hypothetical protein
MTDYCREFESVLAEKRKPEHEPVPNDIKAIELICKKDYKEAIKLLVELC